MSAKLRIPLGLALLVAGTVMVFPFARPYVYLGAARPPDEIAHPLARQDRITTAANETIASRGKIFIPSIKMTEDLIEGVSTKELGYGVGHYPDSAWPGEGRNVVLTGHNFYARTPLFSLLHLVKKGDRVILHYDGYRYEYVVFARHIVTADRLKQYRRREGDRLTMVTCYPPGSTAERLIVVARPAN